MILHPFSYVVQVTESGERFVILFVLFVIF